MNTFSSTLHNIKAMSKVAFHYHFFSQKYMTTDYALEHLEEIKEKLIPSIIIDNNFSENDQKTYLNKFIVESFYTNQTVFNLLNQDYNEREFLFNLERSSFLLPFNLTIEKANIADLQEAHTKKPFCQELLHKIFENALYHGNETLYQWIEPQLIWKEENKSTLFSFFLDYYNKIERNPVLLNTTLNFFSQQKASEFISSFSYISKSRFKGLKKYFPEAFDNIHEVFSSFSSDIQQKLLKQHLPELTVDNIVSFLNKLEKEKDFIYYINFLHNQDLLDTNIIKRLYVFSPHSSHNFFDVKKQFQSKIPDIYLNDLEEEYVKDVFLSYSPLNKKIRFLHYFKENHPDNIDLSKEKILKLLDYFSTNDETLYVFPIEQKTNAILKQYYPNSEDIPQLIPSTDPNDNTFNKTIFIHKLNEFYQIDEEYKALNEFISLLFDIQPELMNDSDFFFSFLRKSQNDLLINAYMEHYLKINDEQSSLNKQLGESNQILVDIFNVLIDKQHLFLTMENLFSEYIPNKISNKELHSMFMKAGQYGTINHLLPSLIERYDINPNHLIMQTVSSFVANTPLTLYLLDNFKLNEKIEQKLCKSAHSTSNLELAQKLIQKDILPNDYYCNIFTEQPNEAGSLLLKAKLRNNLQTSTVERKENKRQKI